MSISNQKLYRLIDSLHDEEKRSAYDYLHYLLERSRNPYRLIDLLEAEDILLSEEEQKQLLDKDDSFISLGDLKRELKI